MNDPWPQVTAPKNSANGAREPGETPLGAESVEASTLPSHEDEAAPATSLQGTADRAPYKLGWGLQTLFDRVFGPVQYPPQAMETIGALSDRGSLVYVTRARSGLLALYLNHALTQLGLPLARFVGGVSMLLWQPVQSLFGGRRSAPQGAWLDRYAVPPTRAESRLADVVSRGEPAMVLLRPPRSLDRRPRHETHDFVRALVAVQRCREEPIYLLPHVLTNKVHSGTTGPTLLDRLFGDRRYPGRLRTLAMLLGAPRQSSVRLAEPLNLLEFCRTWAQADDTTVAKKLRHELNRRISEEERVVAGPKLPSPDAVVRHILRHPEVVQQIQAEAERTGRTKDQVEKRARAQVQRIAARYNVLYIRVLDRVLRWLFNRIYDGVVVDEAGLEAVQAAARRGPVVYCPSHKSHIDYLVLSYVLWQYGVAPPHIAAGANLSFFPLGSIFRRSGAFFLRRSFRDDPLYAALFTAYVEDLIRNGIDIEFFLEGTRSRTGKVLMPKFGLLGMVVDAWRAKARDDVVFVPVSVDYERIIEAKAYERELKGGQKEPETIGGLLRTTKVLRSRYGRVLVQFGDPVSLKDMAANHGLEQSLDDETRWRGQIERLGYALLHEVATISSVTPTSVVATAMLGHKGRGLPEGMLLTLGESVIEYLDTGGARLSAALSTPEKRPEALLEAVRRLVDENLLEVDKPGRHDVEAIYRVPEEKRVLLDYYKNAVMNYFAPGAIVARAIMRRENEALHYDQLQTDTRFLSRLFKREFLYRVEVQFESHFAEAITSLALRGIVDVHEDGAVTINDRSTLELLSGLLDSFVEAYWVTVLALHDLHKFPLWEKELRERALDRSRRAYLEGKIRRPEAANVTLLASALEWMKISGVLLSERKGKRVGIRLSPRYAEGGLEELMREIEPYLF